MILLNSEPASYVVHLNLGGAFQGRRWTGENDPAVGDIQILDYGVGAWTRAGREVYPWHSINRITERF